MPSNMNRSDHDATTDLPTYRKWPRRLLILLVGLGLFVYFLPSLIGLGPIRQRVLDWALADLNGQAQVESVSLGWFSPIELRNLELVDKAGKRVAQVDQIATSQRLIDFLTSDKLGRIDIVKPVIHLVLTREGSNLESLLAPYLQSETDTDSTTLPPLEVSITDGTLQLDGPSQKKTEQFDAIQATLKTSNSAEPIQCQFSMQTPVTASDVGQLSADCLIDLGQNNLRGSTFDIQVTSKQFPLESIAPLASRLPKPVRLQGYVSGDFSIASDEKNSQLTLKAERLNAKDLLLSAPDYIGRDQISLQQISVGGLLGLSSQRITAEQFSLDSDVGELKVDGEFDTSQIIQLVANGKLPSSPFEMDLEADIAQIFQMLPETLHIRNDVEVTSGTASLHMNTRSQSNVQRLVFNLDVANVQAEQNTTRINWNRPLRITGAASENNGEVLIENLSIDSDFFELVGKASLTEGNITYRGDLAQMKQQLGSLLDLSQYQIAGELGGRLEWRHTLAAPAGKQLAPIEFDGNLVIQQPTLSGPGLTNWNERQLQVELNGKVLPHLQSGLAIDAGHFELLLGTDIVTADLLQPIKIYPILSLLSGNQTVPLQALDGLQLSGKITGSLQRWMSHIAKFVDLPRLNLNGNLSTDFTVGLAGAILDVRAPKLMATRFAFEGSGARIEEPEIVATADFQIDLETGQTLIQSAAVSSSAIALTTNQLSIDFTDRLRIVGPVAYQADLQRAAGWLNLCRPSDPIAWSGIADGQFDFVDKNKALGGSLSTNIRQLVINQIDNEAVAPPTNPIARNIAQPTRSVLWQEDQIVFHTDIFIDDRFESLWFGGLKLDSQLCNVRGNGRIDELGSRMLTQIKAKWKIDWDTVAQLTQTSAGPLLKIRGTGWQDLLLNGPLIPKNNSEALWVDPQLKAESTIAWNQASLAEIPIASSQLTLILSDSMLQLVSNSPGIIGNIAKLSPTLNLKSADPILTLQPGTLLQNLQLNEEHTRQWLKFATPVLADATTTKGIISLSTQGAQIPLLAPSQTIAQGEVQLKDLAIGPGPLAHQLLPLLDQVLLLIKPSIADQSQKQKWITMDDQIVRYAIENERVYHDHLKFQYKGMTIETSGSVGFDHTLDLVASIRILDHWIQKEPLLAGLRGESIKIPISGTFSHPQLGRHAIARLSREFLQQTARSALNNVVKEPLENVGENLSGKVTEEIDKLQGKFNQILQEEVGDKLEDGWRNGLDRLFNRGKDK